MCSEILHLALDSTDMGRPLTDCTVVVTGAASEIGKTVAIAAASAGATVLMLDNKKRHMVETYDQILASGGMEPLMIEFDVLKAGADDFTNLQQGISSHYDALHGLVHCAMWGAPLAPVVNSNEDHWLTIYRQQLIAPLSTTRALAPLLNGQHHASIIFSVMDIGRQGRANWGALGAAFAASENLSQTLASEWGDFKTRVNSLDCGNVRTALRRQFFPGESTDLLRDPGDIRIANAYIHLLSSNCQLNGEKTRVAD